jgi:hypothetical protein
MTRAIKLDMDDQREAVLAGWMLLEAVDSPRAWSLYWKAVQLARREFHQTRSQQGRRRMTAATTGDEQGASDPGAQPTRGRSGPARVAPPELSLVAEPSAGAGHGSDATGPESPRVTDE